MKEDLIKTIKENPNLDIVVMASTQELTDEYGYLLLENIRVEVVDIYNSPNNETIYFDKQDIIDELYECFATEENKNLTDKEYKKLCEEKAKDYFYKRAIVIWTSN